MMTEAEEARRRLGRRTILFIDEIHRFNKAQQDAFLPRVEAGDIVLIGATTENPSFEVNSALLSRSKVYVLKPLGPEKIVEILRRALDDPDRGLGALGLRAEDEALAGIARYANGDARVALNLLELAAATARTSKHIDAALIADLTHNRALLYDKSGEEHYNLISALHKSMRNSDPDASVYWLARMLEAGEDPLYVARRLVRFASEDIGNADPERSPLRSPPRRPCTSSACPKATRRWPRRPFIWPPRRRATPCTARIWTRRRPRHEELAEPVPLHLRNAPTKLMKDLEYGKGTATRTTKRRGLPTWTVCPPPTRAGLSMNPPDAGSRRRSGTALRSGNHGCGRGRNRQLRGHRLHLPEHLLAERKDEREPEIALHPANRNTHELPFGIQHAAARDARVPVRQARHELVRRPLADIAGRDDDALRVIVPETEDRVGEFEAVGRDRR